MRAMGGQLTASSLRVCPVYLVAEASDSISIGQTLEPELLHENALLKRMARIEQQLEANAAFLAHRY